MNLIEQLQDIAGWIEIPDGDGSRAEKLRRSADLLTRLVGMENWVIRSIANCSGCMGHGDEFCGVCRWKRDLLALIAEAKHGV